MYKLISYFSVILIVCLKINAEPAPFSLCVGQKSPIISHDISVDVSGCNSTTECPLYRGTSHNFTIQFTPNISSTDPIERQIIAKFIEMAVPIEIPYGRPVPAGDHTFRNSDRTSVTEGGIVANQVYTHNYIFPVMSTAPRTGLRVRYIIRQHIPNLPRPKAKWNRHPGSLFACIEIPVRLH